MIRVVLDTNVLIASIARSSPFHTVWQSFLKGKYELCVSSDILLEYAEIIERLYSVNDAQYVIAQMLLRPTLIKSNRYFEWNVIEHDPDDNKFFDCAVASNVDFIVTEDKHFNVLKRIPFPSVTTIRIAEFTQILSSIN